MNSRSEIHLSIFISALTRTLSSEMERIDYGFMNDNFKIIQGLATLYSFFVRNKISQFHIRKEILFVISLQATLRLCRWHLEFSIKIISCVVFERTALAMTEVAALGV